MQKALPRQDAARLASERRIAIRSDVEVPVVYSFVKNFSSRSYDATARNCSDGGLCIETFYQLNPGQYVSIRKKRTHPAAVRARNGHLLQPYKVAQVRWRRPKTGSGLRRYDVGLCYC